MYNVYQDFLKKDYANCFLP